MSWVDLVPQRLNFTEKAYSPPGRVTTKRYLQKLLTLKRIYWALITHRNVWVDVIYIMCVPKNTIAFRAGTRPLFSLRHPVWRKSFRNRNSTNILSLVRTENPFPPESKHYGHRWKRQTFMVEFTTNTTFCSVLMVLVIFVGWYLCFASVLHTEQ